MAAPRRVPGFARSAPKDARVSATQIAIHRQFPPPDVRFSRDWFGRPARYPARFALWLDADRLHYRFRVPKAPECDLTLSPGDFVEGLWEQDVAELFVMGPDGRYQEFNLSPSGAWWCATFSGYREGATAFSCESMITEATYDDGSWTASLSVDLSDLVVLPAEGLPMARLSVTAILSPRDPEYLCWGHQHGGEPDFHRSGAFLPVSLR